MFPQRAGGGETKETPLGERQRRLRGRDKGDFGPPPQPPPFETGVFENTAAELFYLSRKTFRLRDHKEVAVIFDLKQ